MLWEAGPQIGESSSLGVSQRFRSGTVDKVSCTAAAGRLDSAVERPLAGAVTSCGGLAARNHTGRLVGTRSVLTAARACHGEAAFLTLSVCPCLSVPVCNTSLARRAGVSSVVFPFPQGPRRIMLWLVSKETWRDQPQKQETEERDQTTALAGLTMSEQALGPTGASAMRYDSWALRGRRELLAVI